MQSYCIVIPLYNEAARFNTQALLQFANVAHDFLFVLANDGSKDNTLQILETCATEAINKNIVVFNSATNVGKGNIIQQAMQWVFKNYTPSWVGYWDADFSTPLQGLHWFTKAIEENKNATIIMGSRFRRLGAIIHRKTSRQFLGRILATFISKKLQLPVYDTQCGAKFIELKTAQIVFEQPFKTKWLFDVEILQRYIKHHSVEIAASTIIELPLLEWKHQNDSKIFLKDFIAIPFEYLKL
jgi:dolichyl-phosphate beta-glucosyltransferase